MVFSSIFFLFYFLPITLLIYYIVPRKFKNTVLFIASLIFYGWGEPIYITIMIFSTIVDYSHGILIEKYRYNRQRAKLILLSSIVINLGLLCFFKYTDFFIQNINMLLNTNFSYLGLPLPIGISFYTFQTMSYTIDIYLDKSPVQKNIISFGTYVALFPQLIAGPIVQYNTIAHQLNNRKENISQFSQGIERFAVGLGKKVLLANNIGMLWDEIQRLSTSDMTVFTAWLGIIAFSFQIYFDFSGYSDMAIGLGKIFGFDFLENFNYPYISQSITEFWRRWHISLGSWFRDYVYIPLGGNRVGLLKLFRNIAIVWFLTGFWHGASWNFILWGIYFGVILVLEKGFLLKALSKVHPIIRHIYALFFILIGWVLFSFENIFRGLEYLKIMLGFERLPLYDQRFLYYFTSYGIVLILLILCSTPILKMVLDLLKKKSERLEGVVFQLSLLLIMIFSIAYLVDSTYNPFLYFRF
ncbi:MBOAT family protein [Alkaliphilus sp. MSJ-5]|uniref:MBOAT family protein n=1 Tax=Alkaliphilus flagellatus TaxID=2841507 RepID=A0ABS6G0Q6_9FIRM|nr:MBOAT family O-acyltransferase [Alkaliphilus flagellatus]MBU5675208.1 MBOAT family protein [Alkaliphilus flagellatus]